MTTIIADVPTLDVITAFEADRVDVVRWVDLYFQDNVTVYARELPVTSGNVSIDMDRPSRRNLDIEFGNFDNPDTLTEGGAQVQYGPNGFWYDKIIKPFRGVRLSNGDIWATCLGEFMPDNIARPHFPRSVRCTARDMTKKLMLAKFNETTSFASTANIGTVIQSIAANGGIVKFNFTTTAEDLGTINVFDRGTDRWTACETLAKSVGYELFFDNFGRLTFRPRIDPITAQLSYRFQTGTEGNLESFTKSTNDVRMFNHVLVYGDGPGNPLVFAYAENNNPSSPTSIGNIGRRTWTYANQFISNNTQALAVAQAFLAVMGLEQYDVQMSSLVAPWLEAGDAVEAILPDAEEGDPTRFLLTSFSIPMALGTMDAVAKRITIVS